MTRPMLYACRAFLITALLPTCFVTFLMLRVGLWYSPLEHPFAVLFALLLASGPLWVLKAILLSADEESGRRLAVQTVAIWSVIGLYVLFAFELLPQFIYDGFQTLVR